MQKLKSFTQEQTGTKFENEKFFTSGGRVLAVNAVSEDLTSAREKSYEAIKQISFEGMRYRAYIRREY